MAVVKLEENTLPTADTFPSNSKTKKGEENRPKPTKIISGGVVQKKKPLSRKLADIFISEDVDDVKSYIINDVVIPSIKVAIADAVGGGIDMLLGTNSARGRRSSNNNGTTKYGTFYKGNQNNTTTVSRRNASSYNYDDIILQSRGEAEDVLSTMFDYVDQYGAVSLSDVHDLVGVTGQFTDTYWGWIDLSDASVRHVRDGYLLDLPKIVNLKN